MDRFQAAMGELARSTVEAQLLAVEASIADLVRREVAELAAVVRREVATLASTRPEVDDPLAAATRIAAHQEVVALVANRPDLSTTCAGAALAFGRRPISHDDTKQTIWEAIVLFGLPVIGPMGNAILALNFISSVSLQVLIIYILGSGVIREPIPGAYARQWQELAAHQWNQTSVVDEVLGTGNTIGTAAFQKGITETVGGQTLASGHSASEIMPIMSTMILLLWILSVAHEFHCAFGSAWAVWALPRHATQFVKSGSISVLVSISPPRLCLIITIALARLALAGALLVMGSRRLAGAKSTTELWMSAAALGFALDVPRRTAAWGVIARRG